MEVLFYCYMTSQEEEKMPTRFYKEREHTVEGLKVHRDGSSPIFFKVLTFLARPHLSFMERLYRSCQQDLQR